MRPGRYRPLTIPAFRSRYARSTCGASTVRGLERAFTGASSAVCARSIPIGSNRPQAPPVLSCRLPPPSRLTRGSFDQPFRGGNDSCARVCLRSLVSLRRPGRPPRPPKRSTARAARHQQPRHGRDLPRRGRRRVLGPDARYRHFQRIARASSATTSTSSTRSGIDQDQVQAVEAGRAPRRQAQVPLRVHADQVRGRADGHQVVRLQRPALHGRRCRSTSELIWKAYRFGYE